MRITVGMATCGLSAGAKEIFDALRAAGFDVDNVGCIGMCYNEPIVTVFDGSKKWIYGRLTLEDMPEFIDSLKQHKVMKGFYLGSSLEKINYYKKQLRLVTENSGIINPLNLEQYFESGGYGGLKKAMLLSPDEVIEAIKRSGLRGRGGAGFSTGTKWSFIAKANGKKYLIGNGDEGDPGAFMNRTLMESDPFRIIEGITIGAHATGCDEGFIYTRAEYPLAIETLQKAIDIAYKHNLLGKNILGRKGFNFDLSLRKGAGAFVCGEETALIHSIEGKRGSPTPRPPYPAQRGVDGRPTVVNNVGTWGHVATIMKIGADEYAKIGTEKTKGTMILCITGKVQRTGIVEVPMGTTLHEIVYDIGGGTPKGTRLKGLLTGGPAGGCIPASKLATAFDYESMREVGAMMGSGGLVVVCNQSCMVDLARYFMSFTQQESCGKCTPCREGTKRLLEMLIKVTKGTAPPDITKQLKSLALYVRDNALCGLGQNAPNPVLSTLTYFEHEFHMHIALKQCSSGACECLTHYFITDRCIGCGACKRVCPSEAISGSPKDMHVIDQAKCIKCGACYETCPVKAIERK